MSDQTERSRLAELDGEIIRLLNKRMQLALDAGEGDTPVHDSAAIDAVLKSNEGPLKEEAVRALWREIMSAELALKRAPVIGYLGPQATFTHLAARAKFGGSVSYEALETIGDVFAAVQKGTVDFGVVPIENSTDGAVTHTLDQCMETDLKICAEVYLPISHHLMAKIERSEIKRIYSKAEVFGQCRGWLHRHMPNVDLIPASSTARAAEIASEEPGCAALASSVAAELYGLDILDEDVQDLGGNTTRFLVLARQYGPPTGHDKTSVFFAVKHKVGALYDALSAFRNYNLNMTKIESRPSKSKAWEYFFFVDFEGHADEENTKKALAELAQHCILLTVLGAYPQARRPGE